LEERWIEEKKEWLLKHEARKGLCDEQQTWPPLAWLACVGSEVHMTVLATHQCIRRLPNDSSSLKDRMNNPLYMQHVPAGWQVNSEQHSVHVQPIYTVYNVQYNTYRNCWSREIKLSLFLGIRVQCTQNTLFRNTNVYMCKNKPHWFSFELLFSIFNVLYESTPCVILWLFRRLGLNGLIDMDCIYSVFMNVFKHHIFGNKFLGSDIRKC